MKYLLFLLSILSAHYCQAQPPAIAWQVPLGGPGYDYAYQLQRTPDNGLIIAGGSTSSSIVTGAHGSYDAWMVKLNDTGGMQWQHAYGGSDTDVAVSIINTNDGGYMIAAHTASTNGDITGNHGHMDIWLVKTSPTGAIEWQRTYGGSGEEYVTCIQQTRDSGYIVAGSTNSSDGDVTKSNGNDDYWVLKVSKTGAIQWQRTCGGSGDDIATAVLQTQSGGYFVAGYSTSDDGDVTGNHGGQDFWVLQLSATGGIVWQRSLGGSKDDFANTVLQDADGGYVIAGGSNSIDGDITGNNGMGDGWIVKLSAAGSTVWKLTAGGKKNDAVNAIQHTADGGYIAAGFMDSESDPTFRGSTDYWLMKISATGVIEWQRCMGSLGIDVATSVQTTADSGYYVGGYSFYWGGDVAGNYGHCDYWVVKLKDEVVNAVPITDQSQKITIVPNPVINDCYVEGAKNVSICLYNASGKLVAINRNTDHISLSNQPPGSYLVTVLDADGQLLAKEKLVKQ